MRALLILFLIYLNYAVCTGEFYNPKKPYPKKVNTEMHRKMHLGRFLINNEPNRPPETMKKRANLRDYTVFPAPARKAGVIGSPYFPFDENINIKKELFQPEIRRKRSVLPGEHDDAKLNLRRKGSKRIARKSVKKGKSKPKAKRSGKIPKKLKVARSKKEKKAHKDSRRLIAAKDATIEEYPYTVSIQKGKDHWCSGALLNQRMVITTANCVWKGSRMSRLKIRAGSRYVDRGGQTAKIQEVMRHPKWSIRSYPDNDVALLLLDRRIRFSDSVHAVDLPNRIMLPPFNDAWVTGFGANRRDGLYPTTDMTLQVYHSQLMDREKCNNVTMRFGVAVTENFICLGQAGRRAPCTRDTGAPAVSDGVVWGLASWGIRKLCGTERFPAVFSYLASQANMDFIMNATMLLMSEKRHYPLLDRYPKRTFNVSAQTTADYYYTGQH